jgi:hypothetical protein
MPIDIRNTLFERIATQKASELIERLKKGSGKDGIFTRR